MAALVFHSLVPCPAGELKLDSSSCLDSCLAVASSCPPSIISCSRPFLSGQGSRRGPIARHSSWARVLFYRRHTLRSSERAGWGKPCNESRRSGQVFAKGTDDSFSTDEMTLETALKLLGVGEGASFDEILGAKRSLVDSSGGDQDRISQLEAAYDTLLMQSLLQRRSGKVLDSSIRYADVRRAKSLTAGGGPDWLKGALQKSPVAIQTPHSDTIVIQSCVYGALAIWTFASGVSSTNQVGISNGADVPGFILAVGFGASLYFLRKQNLKLGKATLITVGGLVVGAVLGGFVESWLRVDIIPFLGVGSPAIVVSEFVLLSLYLTSMYLR